MRGAAHAVPSSEPWRDWQEPRPSIEHGEGSSSVVRQRMDALAMGSTQEMSKGFSVAAFQDAGFPFSYLGTLPVVSVAFSKRAQMSPGPLTGHLSEMHC